MPKISLNVNSNGYWLLYHIWKYEQQKWNSGRSGLFIYFFHRRFYNRSFPLEEGKKGHAIETADRSRYGRAGRAAWRVRLRNTPQSSVLHEQTGIGVYSRRDEEWLREQQDQENWVVWNQFFSISYRWFLLLFLDQDLHRRQRWSEHVNHF